MHILWSVLVRKVMSMFPSCFILPQMAPCASLLPQAPGFQEKQVQVFVTFISTLKKKKKKKANNKTLSIFLTAIILTLKNEYPSTGQLLSSDHRLSSWLQRSGNFPNFQGSPSLSFFINWPMVSRTKAQLHKRDAPHSSSQSALEYRFRSKGIYKSSSCGGGLR